MSQEKFRPAFTIAEINYLIERCTTDSRPEMASMAYFISSRLKVFTVKVDLGIIGAAFTSAPKTTLEEKLGLDSPEEKRLAAFRKWNVDVALCTPEEILLVKTYRYENNLMTKEEQEQYEKL